MTTKTSPNPWRLAAGMSLLMMLTVPWASAPAAALPDPTLPDPIGPLPDLPVNPCGLKGPVGWPDLSPALDLLEPIVGPGVKGSWDYGDAPDSTKSGSMPTYYTGGGATYGKFPTLASTAYAFHPGQPGARHRIVNVAWLGNVTPHQWLDTDMMLPGDIPPSLEVDADAGFDADTTHNLEANSPDHDVYDDGLLGASLTLGGMGTLSFRVSSPVGIQKWYVNALIDFSFDGRWAGVAGTGLREWVVQNQVVSVPAGQSLQFTSAPFFVWGYAGQPWTRITLSDKPITGSLYGGVGWDGETPPGQYDLFGAKAFNCGETEDYCGLVQLRPKDPNQTGHDIRCVKPAGGQVECGAKSSVTLVSVSTNGVAGVSAISPYTTNPGLALSATSVRLYGMDVLANYCRLEGWILTLDKTVSAPATSSPGPRWNVGFNPSPVCSNGQHSEHLGFWGQNNQPLDHGDYTLKIQWWGCDGNFGTIVQNVIVLPP